MTDPPLRLGLVGPILPFRSGIAQHTTRLHQAMRKRVDLTTLSFSRQYPKWLFPGESDRDPFHADHAEPGVSYVLDSLNPVTWRGVVRTFQRAGVSAVVVPWWTIFFAPLVTYLRNALTGSGISVVFMCHNVVDHEASHYKRQLSKLAISGAKGYCAQSQAEAERLLQLVPDAKVTVHAHPLYDQFPAPRESLPRRAPLELLFFGVIRPYKGLDVLLRALAQVERRDVHLSIVGEFWKNREELSRLIEELGLGHRVELVPRYVSDAEAAGYFARADVVILPYRSASGTGIIPMAYHYGKPVVATRIGGLADAVLEGRTGYLVAPESPGELANAIDRLSLGDLDRMHPEIEKFKAGMTWEGLSDALIALATS